jgi:putative holliday junction resolvase
MSIDSSNSAKISHILGIDYGKINVGLALADSETKMAFAYNTIKNSKDLAENLTEIMKKENIGKVIIGIPEYRGNTVNRVSEEAKKLGEFLENSLKIEVFYQNEMFTTKMAQANLKEKGMKGVNKFDDQESARIILQEWLDNN